MRWHGPRFPQNNLQHAMDMEADDNFSDLSEFSDLGDFSNLMETVWGSSEEEDGDCAAESTPTKPALSSGGP